jgi:hypothetical protein
MKKIPFRRDTSLFDTLQDEADEAATTIAVAEMDERTKDDQTVVTTAFKWRRLRLPKVRSIPKLRSFRRKKKTRKEQGFDQDFDQGFDQGFDGEIDVYSQ